MLSLLDHPALEAPALEQGRHEDDQQRHGEDDGRRQADPRKQVTSFRPHETRRRFRRR